MAQRDLLKIIFQNFMKSIRPREFRGTLRGSDLFGNKYYEKVADPSVGRRKPSRYFEPLDKSAFDQVLLQVDSDSVRQSIINGDDFLCLQEIAPEWEAWLRGRRDDPPTLDELEYNKALMEMKQKKAEAIDAGVVKTADQNQQALEAAKRGVESFPSYGDEYEISAGYKHKR